MVKNSIVKTDFFAIILKQLDNINYMLLKSNIKYQIIKSATFETNIKIFVPSFGFWNE